MRKAASDHPYKHEFRNSVPNRQKLTNRYRFAKAKVDSVPIRFSLVEKVPICQSEIRITESTFALAKRYRIDFLMSNRYRIGLPIGAAKGRVGIWNVPRKWKICCRNFELFAKTGYRQNPRRQNPSRQNPPRQNPPNEKSLATKSPE